MRKILVVCGPTASGKSLLARRIAQDFNAVIVNADALQVYKQLPIITASPSAHDLELAQHLLYNHVSVTQEYSVARYVVEASNAINSLQRGQNIIVVGGSGMYVNSLIYGYHKLPEVNQNLRQEIRLEVEKHGVLALYEKLLREDHFSAVRLNPSDTKRIVRSYEIFKQTGRSIASFYTDDNLCLPLADCDIAVLYLEPERNFLYRCCDDRFEDFMKRGALEEAQEILRIWDSVNTSAKRALGLREIIQYLQAQISLSDAIALAKQKTRNFAKRQITWFANQLKERYKITFGNCDEFYTKIDSFEKTFKTCLFP